MENFTVGQIVRRTRPVPEHAGRRYIVTAVHPGTDTLRPFVQVRIADSSNRLTYDFRLDELTAASPKEGTSKLSNRVLTGTTRLYNKANGLPATFRTGQAVTVESSDAEGVRISVSMTHAEFVSDRLTEAEADALTAPAAEN